MQLNKLDFLAVFLAITGEMAQNVMTIAFYSLSCVSLLISIKNKTKNKNDD